MKIWNSIKIALHYFCQKKHIWRWAIAIVGIFLCVSFWQKDQFKNITDIRPEILQEPLQSDTTQEPIIFERDGYQYTVTPLYEYTLQGLIVSAKEYKTWYNLSRVANTVTKDICLIWGETVAQHGYQDKTLSIAQDFRFCLYRYRTNDIVFNGNELSNSHLIPRDKKIEKKINALQSSDQVRIRGKLVNVTGILVDTAKKFENTTTEWQSSTTRDDTGAGACEVIYVEDVEVLQKGHPLYQLIYQWSIGALGVLILMKIVCFFSILKSYQIKKSEEGDIETPLDLY